MNKSARRSCSKESDKIFKTSEIMNSTLRGRIGEDEYHLLPDAQYLLHNVGEQSQWCLRHDLKHKKQFKGGSDLIIFDLQFVTDVEIDLRRILHRVWNLNRSGNKHI